MGSAASSLRRWLSVALLLAAGVGLAVLWPGSDPVDLPTIRSQPDDAVAVGLPTARTATLELGPGRRVPAVAGDEAVAVGIADDGGHEEPTEIQRLEVGDPTVGAVIDVAAEASMFIAHGVSQRHLAYRFNDNGRWGEWSGLSAGADESPDGLTGGEGYQTGALAGPPVPIPLGVSEVELVITGGDTSSFDITFLDLGNEPKLPAPAGAAIGEGVAAQVVAPPIIEREQWATFEWDYQNESCQGGPSVADHLAAVVVHHTVTTNNYSEAATVDLLRAIHYSHVVINGWCDIGYNFVVDRFGRVWEARTGSIDDAVIGGHARGFNTSTMGVALLGQHHPGARPAVATVSDPASSAVEALAKWKLGIYGVDPAGKSWLRNRSTRAPLRLAGDSWHYLPAVLGHRDLGVTSCPGNHGATLVDQLPSRLAATRDVSLPYSFVGWQAHSHGPGFVVVDGLGGIRPAGASSPWSQAPAGLSGGDTAVAVGGGLGGGYLLTTSGTLVGYGIAPAVSGTPTGSADVVDLVVRSDTQSGWVLDGSGTLHGFGGAADIAAAEPVGSAVAAAVLDDGRGYIVGRSGELQGVGGSPPMSIDSALSAGVDAIDVDITVGLGGAISGFVLDETGRIHGFGGQPSTRVTPPEAVVAIAAADPGSGGWVLDKHGQLWPFGGARLIFPVSTNATAGNAVDLDNVGTVYSPSFVNGDTSRFISSAYGLFAGRAPTSIELDLEATDLEQGASRVDLTSALATSEFWTGAKLDQMYRDVLDRNPDPEGRAYWLSEIGGGLTLQDLGTYFYGSQEYANAAGSTEAYVTGLYNVLLNRAPDPDGLAYRVGVLGSGEAKPPDVANGFYASIESRRDRVAALHQQILGAAPNDEETTSWADRLLAVGDVGVAAEMAASNEYYRLAVDGPEP